MREKNITRTIEVRIINVSVYDTDIKSIKTEVIKLYDVDNKNVKKAIEKAVNGIVLEFLEISIIETKYSMSIDDFIKYGKEV